MTRSRQNGRRNNKQNLRNQRGAGCIVDLENLTPKEQEVVNDAQEVADIIDALGQDPEFQALDEEAKAGFLMKHSFSIRGWKAVNNAEYLERVEDEDGDRVPKYRAAFCIFYNSIRDNDISTDLIEALWQVKDALDNGEVPELELD
jgi:hypothetical protein